MAWRQSLEQCVCPAVNAKACVRATARSWEKDVGQILPQASLEGTNPAATFVSDSWPPELWRTNFCSVRGYLSCKSVEAHGVYKKVIKLLMIISQTVRFRVIIIVSLYFIAF